MTYQEPVPNPGVTPATIWAAEGARVGLVTCLECGAALLLDPRSEFDVPMRHALWHADPLNRDKS